MKPGLKLSLFFILLSLCLTGNAPAKLSEYTYPYDISQIEWQLLNWTAAWRNTTTPAGPFILERMEYSRKGKQVIIYLNGKPAEATEENLKKSVDGIVALFKQRFSTFEPLSDLCVYYKLQPDNGDVLYKEYNNGAFADRDSPPEGSNPQQPAIIPLDTSY